MFFNSAGVWRIDASFIMIMFYGRNMIWQYVPLDMATICASPYLTSFPDLLPRKLQQRRLRQVLFKDDRRCMMATLKVVPLQEMRDTHLASLMKVRTTIVQGLLEQRMTCCQIASMLCSVHWL